MPREPEVPHDRVDSARERLRRASRPSGTDSPQSRARGVAAVLGRAAAQNPVAAGTVAVAALTIFGPGRTLRWGARAVTMAGAASKVVAGLLAAQDERRRHEHIIEQPRSVEPGRTPRSRSSRGRRGSGR